MKLLVVGGGGREHALVDALRKSSQVTKIYCAPGNGGIAAMAECVAIKATEIERIADFAKEHQIDLVVVAPDDPLAMGLVDLLEQMGIPSFGPTKAAARIESSKVFAKNLMEKYNIPSAQFATFSSMEDAVRYVEQLDSFPIVIKADGLALGKGVIIAETMEQAYGGLKQILVDKIFGDSGNLVVIEEFLTGPEVSVLAFCDGQTIKPMMSSMDHKRALDGNRGLNTGGMGAISPNPHYTDQVAARCMDEIFLPTVRAMQLESASFKGCLYFGLMLTPTGPKVIEYNCRFGDPETQVVLPLLETDLLTIMQAVYEERLDSLELQWKKATAACVVIASGGYPEVYTSGYPITGLDQQGQLGEAMVYHAGTVLDVQGQYNTAGGRVMGITAVADTLQAALESTYCAVEKIRFTDAFYRKDIGKY